MHVGKYLMLWRWSMGGSVASAPTSKVDRDLDC